MTLKASYTINVENIPIVSSYALMELLLRYVLAWTLTENTDTFDIVADWDNIQRSAKGIHKYSWQTRETSEWKTRGGEATKGFSRGFFSSLEWILCDSAERSSAYCHYSTFVGRHKHSRGKPRLIPSHWVRKLYTKLALLVYCSIPQQCDNIRLSM